MRKFKLASILAILTLTFSIAPACSKTITRKEPLVCLGTIYYHQIGCKLEGIVSSPTGLYKAQKTGYTACPECKGIPHKTLTVEETYELSGLGCKQSCTDWLIDRNN